MGGSSFTFRCGECNRLLGVSRSRVGSTVQCPKCGTDLVVPDPDDGRATPTEVPAPESSVSGESATVGSTAGRETVGFAGIALDPEPFSLRPRESSRPHRVPDRSSPPAAAPVVPAGGGLEGLRVEEPRLSGAEKPPLAPETRTLARSGDVILPRTALILWSFVMLVALVLAFTAGILAGHFLWKPSAATIPAAAVPAQPPAPRG